MTDDLDDVAQAMGVLADQDKAAVVDGYYLVPQSIATGIWGVYREYADNADMIDAIRADRFKSALQLVHYLQRLDEPGEATEGDLTAPEVA